MTEGLTEDRITVSGNAFLPLLLQATATMLIFAEARDLSHYVLKTCASKAISNLAERQHNATGDRVAKAYILDQHPGAYA